MASKSYPIVALSEMEDGQEADLFALLVSKEELRTREGKPYFRVTFRDARREVAFPIWGDSVWAAECRASWSPGACYKLRAVFRHTAYGPQLDIQKIRETCAADAADGFDPLMCLPQSRHDPRALFEELLALVEAEIPGPLGRLTAGILQEHRAALLQLPAAVHHHHAYVGGFLEHALSVGQACAHLAGKYAALYPDLSPALDRGLTVAGGVLHDIGKVREIEQQSSGAAFTPAGHLLGHLVLGRDVLREAAGTDSGVDPETLLRLEHIIVSHQAPEWGSPKPPMTPEALIVHYAESLDARFQMMHQALRDSGEGLVTGTHHPLRQAVYRGAGGKS